MLADRGFLEAAWDEPVMAGRTPRHLYRLTSEGLALVQEVVVAARAWSQLLLREGW